ncbi:hypothetical protein INR49_006700 [Caranx melampygus]|nr:hypothetical protein INR49_006700 [Caranx melampygus]
MIDGARERETLRFDPVLKFIVWPPEGAGDQRQNQFISQTTMCYQFLCVCVCVCVCVCGRKYFVDGERPSDDVMVVFNCSYGTWNFTVNFLVSTGCFTSVHHRHREVPPHTHTHTSTSTSTSDTGSILDLCKRPLGVWMPTRGGDRAELCPRRRRRRSCCCLVTQRMNNPPSTTSPRVLPGNGPSKQETEQGTPSERPRKKGNIDGRQEV